MFRRLLVAGKRRSACILDVLSWRCSWDLQEEEVEFGGWGRRIEKEFVSGSYTNVCLLWTSGGISRQQLLAAHQQGCSVCGFSRPIFRSCSPGRLLFCLFFFFAVLWGPLSTTCTNSAFSIFSEGALQLVVLWLATEMCLCEVLSGVALGKISTCDSATLVVMKTSFCGRSCRWWACSQGGGRTRGKQADLVAQESSCTPG